MSWLENMSARPSTAVQLHFRPLGGVIVVFRFEVAAAALALATPRLAQQLEERWRRLALRGAAHVYPWHEQSGPAHTEQDPLLVLNVLGRTRGQVLLGHTPLCLEERYLHRNLASDDPRLLVLP